MNTQKITSAQLLEGLAADLLAIGFDERAVTGVTQFGRSISYGHPVDPIAVIVRVEEVTTAGVDDLVSVTVQELDAKGWTTGTTHTTSHLNERNARALVAFVEALAEVSA